MFDFESQSASKQPRFAADSQVLSRVEFASRDESRDPSGAQKSTPSNTCQVAPHVLANVATVSSRSSRMPQHAVLAAMSQIGAESGVAPHVLANVATASCMILANAATHCPGRDVTNTGRSLVRLPTFWRT